MTKLALYFATGVFCAFQGLELAAAQSVSGQSQSGSGGQFGGPSVRPQVPEPDCGEFLFPMPFHGGAGNPGGVVALDFDGDGDVDVATCDRAAGALFLGTVSIFENLGGGEFSEATSVAVGSGPAGLEGADLDGDGDVDLVAANGQSATFTVLQNDGTGTFTPLSTQPTVPFVWGVTSGDFDGDGDRDLALCGLGSNAIFLHSNDGTGAFSSGSAVTNLSSIYDLCSVDVDADGDLDLVAAAGTMSAGIVHVLKNGGSGSFTLHDTKNLPFNAFTQSVACGDLDGDGDVDVVAGAAQLVNVYVMLNAGTGTLSSPVAYSVASQNFDHQLSDMDADGDLDIVAVRTPGPAVLLNQGNGTFAPAQPYVAPAGKWMALADLDLDGDTDLAASHKEHGGVLSIRNLGGGQLEALAPLPSIDLHALLRCDIDGDLDLDLLGTRSIGIQHRLLVIRNSGNGVLSAPSEYALPGEGYDTSSADMDLDGDLDVAVTTSAGVCVVPNLGNGTFGAFTTWGGMGGGTWLAILTNDFNGDGYPDLVRGDSFSGASAVMVRLSDGAGGFAPNVSYSAAGSGLISADFDGDGDVDLALGNEVTGPDLVDVLFNSGAGTFGAPVHFPAGDGPSQLVALDFDGDGDMDVATTGLLDGRVWLMENQGSGTFASPVSVTPAPLGDGVRYLFTSDLDRDGDPDLMCDFYRTDVGGVAYLGRLMNQGGGSFTLTRHALQQPSEGGLAIGRMDADLSLDLAWVFPIYGLQIVRNACP